MHLKGKEILLNVTTVALLTGEQISNCNARKLRIIAVR